MADIDDLGYTSILDMTHDEALDTLRQIRLSRRTPEKKTRTVTMKTVKKPVISQASAIELLKIIGGSK